MLPLVPYIFKSLYYCMCVKRAYCKLVRCTKWSSLYKYSLLLLLLLHVLLLLLLLLRLNGALFTDIAVNPHTCITKARYLMTPIQIIGLCFAIHN